MVFRVASQNGATHPKGVQNRPRRNPPKQHEDSKLDLEYRSGLGILIRELRYPTYSQEEFAEAIEVSRSHMSVIERGLSDIRLSTLLRIASALELTPDELLKQVREANIK